MQAPWGRRSYIFFNHCTPSDQQVVVGGQLSHIRLCDPMDCSISGFPVLHYLSEFAQIPLHWWCHPTISSSVAPSSSCLQSFLASLSFPMGQLFASGGQSIGASATASVQFSCSGMSDSLRPHGLKHTRAPCPSPTPEVYSNLCPSSRWCHLTISSSVVPFSSCPQSFPVWGFFQISQFFESGGQSFGVSTSAAVLPINIHDWFSLGLTGLISLQFEGPSKVFSAAAIQCCWMNEQEEKKRKTKSNSFLPR